MLSMYINLYKIRGLYSAGIIQHRLPIVYFMATQIKQRRKYPQMTSFLMKHATPKVIYLKASQKWLQLTKGKGEKNQTHMHKHPGFPLRKPINHNLLAKIHPAKT